MLAHRIADPRILQLVRMWLEAGVLESGEWCETDRGNAARGGDQPAPCQHLPALCPRSLGPPVPPPAARAAIIISPAV